MDIDNKEINDVIDFVKGLYKSFTESKTSKKETKTSGMFVWKESEQYRWLACYSNNYEDRDSDIISKASHKRFVEKVDNGSYPMPVLRHWHVKGTDYGIADLVTFDEDTGVAIASGYIYPDHVKEAELLSQMDNIATSHGMPIISIVRDDLDNRVIKEHQTIEISDLPHWAAANTLSDFCITKEEDMTIPKEKAKYLSELGIDVSELESKLKEKANMATEQELDFKEAPKAAEEVKEEVVVVAAEEVKVEEVKEAKVETTEKGTDVVILETLKSISDAVISLGSRIEAIEKSRETDKEKSIDLTPAASIAAMIARDMSALSSKEAKMNKNNKLVDEAPAETPVTKEKKYAGTQSDIINSVISGIIN